MKIDDKENLINLELFFSEKLDYYCYFTKNPKLWNGLADNYVLVLEVSSLMHMINLLDNIDAEKYQSEKILNGEIPVPEILHKRFGLIPLKEKDYSRYGVSPSKPRASFFKGMTDVEIKEYYDGVKENYKKLYKNYGLSLGFRPSFMVSLSFEYTEPAKRYYYCSSAFAGMKAKPYLDYFLYCFCRECDEFKAIPTEIVEKIENFLKEKGRPIFDSL